MHGSAVFWAVALTAVTLTGLSKGGFAGVGAISTPMLALVMPPASAAALLLPILILQDMVGVWAFRRTIDRRILMIMLPGAALGIVAAALFASRAPQQAMMVTLGLISIAFGGFRLWGARPGAAAVASPGKGPVGFLLGIASGFSSQIAHAGQPPFQIWVLPQRLEANVLIGTSALYYAALNWMKLPAFALTGQFARVDLTRLLVLAPVSVATTLLGVWLVRRVEASRFYLFIFASMIGVGGLLLAEGLGLFARHAS